MGGAARGILEQAAQYGLYVRLQRAAALPQGSSDALKMAEIRKISDWYNSGATEWDIPKGPRENPFIGEVIRALAAVQGTTEDSARVFAVAKAEKLRVSLASWCQTTVARNSAVAAILAGDTGSDEDYGL